MRRMRCSIVILGMIFSIIIAGCSGSECYDNHSALPLAGFYSYPYEQKISLNRVTIYGVGAPGDSMLYYQQNLSEAYLPFRLDSDTTTYVFEYPPAVEGADVFTDSVTFIYNRKPWFVSPACGAMYFYEIKEVKHTHLLIDSIATDATITNANSQNIKIFFDTGE